MSDGAKATIAMIIAFIIVGISAFAIASAISTTPDTKETIQRLQDISTQVVKDQKITSETSGSDGVSTQLTFAGDTKTIVVSTNKTKITVTCDKDWNITAKNVSDLTTSFGTAMGICCIIGLSVLMFVFGIVSTIWLD